MQTPSAIACCLCGRATPSDVAVEGRCIDCLAATIDDATGAGLVESAATAIVDALGTMLAVSVKQIERAEELGGAAAANDSATTMATVAMLVDQADAVSRAVASSVLPGEAPRRVHCYPLRQYRFLRTFPFRSMPRGCHLYRF